MSRLNFCVRKKILDNAQIVPESLNDPTQIVLRSDLILYYG